MTSISFPTISILLLLLFTLLCPSISQPEADEADEADELLLQSITAATSHIRTTQEIQRGADHLSALLSSLSSLSSVSPLPTTTASLLSLVQNNLAAAILLGATSSRHSVMDLLQSSMTLSPWCSAPYKNFRWYFATIPDDQQEKNHNAQSLRLSLSLELHSWRQAVNEFARRGKKGIDPSVYQAMIEDRLVRYLSWCNSDFEDEDEGEGEGEDEGEGEMCSSALGAPVALFVDKNNHVVTSADDKRCQHKDVWINLFDDEAVPAHRHICHPPRLKGGKRNQLFFTGSKYLDLLYRVLTGFIHQRTNNVVPMPSMRKKNNNNKNKEAPPLTATSRPRSFSWSLSYGSVFGESSWLARDPTTPPLGGNGGGPASDVDDVMIATTKQCGDDTAMTGVQVGSLAMLDMFIQNIVKQDIKGDVVECGVWRGGSSIAMAASLSERGGQKRKVWLFDSFSGVPKASDDAPDYDEVKGWTPHRYAASLETVQRNFIRFGLDEWSIYVVGNFDDTMNQKNVNSSPLRMPASISLLRIDVDSYEGTKLVLDTMYERVSKGGFIVVDDFHLRGCRAAVHEFRDNLTGERPLMFTPNDHVNTCELDDERSETGLNESLLGGDLDVTLRSGPQVVWWRKE